MSESTAPSSTSFRVKCRAYRRAFLLASWMGFVSLVWRITKAVCPFRKGKVAISTFAKKAMCIGNLKILNWKIDQAGAPPPKPFFLVCNHLSYMDILVLSTVFGGIFVSKKEVADWPIFGKLAKWWETIFISRESKKDIVRVLKAFDEPYQTERGIVVFPEGTSSNGEQVLPFFSPLLMWPAKNNVPVHYAHIAYETLAGDPPARDAVCWWGDAEFAPHFFGLMGLKGVNVSLQFGEQPIHTQDRKLLAEQLFTAVSQCAVRY